MSTPIVLGSAGLVGRPQVRPTSVHLEEEPLRPEGERFSIPANCLRVLNSPLAADRGGGCQHDCPGKQRDGGCLCDIVSAANQAGIAWSFQVDAEGYWVSTGDAPPEIP